MTDYSLWEVILNGDSPIPTKRLAKKNELKAHGTLLMALPDKHQLKFNIHKDAKTLMEAIEKRFGGNKETNKNKTDLEDQSLDDLFNSLKIYEAEVKSSSSASTSTQNISFVSSQHTNSTNEPDSVVASVSAASEKILVFALPNVDTLSNAQKDADDLDEIDLKWQMARLTVRARRFLQRTGRNLRVNGPTSIGFDMSKVECYNYYRKGYFARECSVMVWAAITGAFRQKKNQPTMPSWHSPLQVLPVLTMRKSQFDVISYKTRLDYVEDRILVYQQNETVFEKDIKLLKLDVHLRDSALVVLRQKFEKAKQERDELKLKLEKFQTFLKDLSQLLASQTNDKIKLGYDTQVFTSSMFDYNEMFSSETDDSLPASLMYDRPSAPIIEDWVSDTEDESEAEPLQNDPSFVKPTKHVKPPMPSVKPIKHPIPAPKTAIPKPKTHGNSRNRKACFVCKSLTHLIKDCDYYEKKMAQTHARNHAQRRNHLHYARMTYPNPQRHVVPTTILTKSKLVPLTAARLVTTVVPQPYVTRPKPAKIVVTKPYSPPRRTINHRPSPAASNFPPQVTTVKAPKVYVVNGVLGNYVWKPKCPILDHVSQHSSASMTLKRFNYNDAHGRSKSVMAWATLDESNLWNRRLGHINFKTMNKLVKGFMRPFRSPVTILNTLDPLGKFDGKADEGFLVGYSVSSKAFRVFTSRTRIIQETLHINFLENKPNVAGNQSNPSAGVQEQFDAEKAGKENVTQYVLFPLWSSGSKDPHNTDGDATFEVKEPEFKRRKPESEVHVSPSSSAKTKKHDDKTKRDAKGKSHVELSTGYRNLSVEFEDFFDNSINEVNATSTPVPTVKQISTNSTNTFSVAALEDITYSNDEEDVGAEADFSNLETTITVSPIPTTSVHKDHHVTQIIGDLSLATQTRSMTRMVKDQGGATSIQDAKCLGLSLFAKWKKGYRIEAIRLFLAYASFMGFMVYKMDVKSAFLYGTIEEEVYVCQPLRFEDLDYLEKVYKVDKYVAENLRKFGLTDRKSASTPIDTEKPLLKDPDGDDVVGKGFSRVETPSFEGMLVPQQASTVVDDVVHDSVPATDAEPTPPTPPPTTTPPPPPQELPSISQVVPTPPPLPIAQPLLPPQQQQPS
uniref:Ribonuclease H-like domain-containing protein n=1 Tax=Tanacetum cinerariifolium TaxID=118510 RepID=A0A6L2NGM7_TANCI|nr:ribonuclease H-like domain-containing protein [Tanacetum cinerariifolium]